ncbi:hypothetical protein SDC9_85487 [bioreactor metagenome]|uniref:Uncharacterized protein n=1 Tax=bioreactor metagenome TaxID=1076179 RepID=A0A644ZDT8_9ZZZZ
MARLFDQGFKVQLHAAECLGRRGLRLAQRAGHFVAVTHRHHADAAATVGGLEHQRVAHGTGDGGHSFNIVW